MEGSGHDLFQYYPVICPEVLRKTSVRITGVSVEIRTEHMLSTSLQRYR